MRTLTLTVDEAWNGSTVKHLLRARLHMAEGLIARVKLRETGLVRNGERVFTNARLRTGDVLCVEIGDEGAVNEALPIAAPLTFVYEDEDIAVLKLVDAEDLPVAEFGNSDLTMVGEQVYAIGNPLGIELRCTLTDGIISAVDRDVQLDGRTLNVIQTTAALNNGNSGGPLISRFGQVIGINTLKMSGTGGADEASVEGLGFALPISHVCYVVNDIIATGRFHGVPTLGIMVATYENDDGGTYVQVVDVTDGTSAQEAGVQEGDVIVAVDGHSTATTDDLMAVRRTHIAGETMTLTLSRGGQTISVDVVLRASND